jgi:ATP-dependent DNA helicase RecG
MKFKETETIELKKSTSELKEGVISIAAILNKHGRGELYFGVRNDGVVVGQQFGEATLREVSRAISDHIEPKIYPTIQIASIGGKPCIHVEFEGDDSPYFAYGRVYMRLADEDRQVSAKEIERLILKKNNYKSPWETKVSELSIQDASVKTIKHFVKRANEAGRLDYRYDNARNVLHKLELTKGNNLLNSARVLFSGRNRIEVQAAIFAGNDKNTFLDIKSFKGNLFDLIRESESYVKEHINWRADLSGSQRKDIPEIPVRAISEAVINSLCHRLCQA